MLHHGTLLFNADLNVLKEAIQVIPGRYFDKAVKSNRSEVGNISSFLSKRHTMRSFTLNLYKFLQRFYGAQENYVLKKNESDIIRKLRDDKYVTTEWIYYYSPPFRVLGEVMINGKLTQLELVIEKGKIRDTNFSGDISESNWDFLSRKMNGEVYDPEKIRKTLSSFGLFTNDQITNVLKTLF